MFVLCCESLSSIRRQPPVRKCLFDKRRSLRYRRNYTLVKSVCKTALKSLFPGPHPVYQDLGTRHDWPVENAIVDLPIRLMGNSKRISSNSLNPLRARNKEQG